MTMESAHGYIPPSPSIGIRTALYVQLRRTVDAETCNRSYFHLHSGDLHQFQPAPYPGTGDQTAVYICAHASTNVRLSLDCRCAIVVQSLLIITIIIKSYLHDAR